MNANETAFAVVLEGWKQEGLIQAYEYEGMTLNLAPRTTITFDFVVVEKDGTLVMVECKGGKKNGTYHIEEDAWVKTKLAAAKYPYLKILLTWVHKDYPRQYKEVFDLGDDGQTFIHEEAA